MHLLKILNFYQSLDLCISLFVFSVLCFSCPTLLLFFVSVSSVLVVHIAVVPKKSSVNGKRPLPRKVSSTDSSYKP